MANLGAVAKKVADAVKAAAKQKAFQAALLNAAVSKLGQKGLGDGGCSRLIEWALDVVGAKPGVNNWWGLPLWSGQTLEPGLIIQFKSYVIKDSGYTWNLGDPDHTAIVAAVSGTKVTLLHQNFNPPPAILNSYVRTQTFDLARRVSGYYTAFRPEPK